MKVKGAVKVKATEQKRGIPGPPNLVPLIVFFTPPLQLHLLIYRFVLLTQRPELANFYDTKRLDRVFLLFRFFHCKYNLPPQILSVFAAGCKYSKSLKKLANWKEGL